MIKAYKNRAPVIADTCFVAETATVIGDVEIGPHCSVWYGAVIRGDVNSVRIGSHCNIQDNATLHVDRGRYSLSIGSRVTIGHNAVVHACVVEDDCLVGIGAVLLDGAVIGESSIVGAGAVVRPGTVVPPRSLLAGVPARIVRELDSADMFQIRDNAEAYVTLKDEYRGNTD
jgi:carbonic anhydrase/acetyltransferase-like protein (isoleucine patch superfamily)